jgi:hypothetical protein
MSMGTYDDLGWTRRVAKGHGRQEQTDKHACGVAAFADTANQRRPLPFYSITSSKKVASHIRIHPGSSGSCVLRTYTS